MLLRRRPVTLVESWFFCFQVNSAGDIVVSLIGGPVELDEIGRLSAELGKLNSRPLVGKMFEVSELVG